MDLDATRRLLAVVGDPHHRFPSVLIGGTNGKGTVATFLARMAEADGRRVGLFTSPHLVRREEQICVDGRPIEALDDLFNRLRGADPDLQSTPFELLTAAAFLHFAEERVDLAIVEVGMGGARDCTNVLEPLLSVITNVGRDHHAFLGFDPQNIAREKAGILRSGRPAIFGPTSRETSVVLEEIAERLGATPILTPRNYEIIEDRPHDDERRRIVLKTSRVDELEIRLAGRWQAHLLALAVLAARQLDLSPEAVAAGAAACRRPGRMEHLRIPDRRPILLDAAHNVDAVEALTEEIKTLEEPPDLLFGAFADKEIEEMLRRLMPHVRRTTWTCPSDLRRSWTPRRFESLYPKTRIIEAADEALTAMLAESRDRLLLVCGSLRLVGDVRALLGDFGDLSSI